MKFKMRDVVTGIIVIVVVIVAGLLYKNLKSPKVLPTITPTESMNGLVEGFNYQIPDDVESVELKDVSGGSSKAIATRKYESGVFTHAVLADLPDLTVGFYEGWLVAGEKFISTGKLRIAKGGYLLEYSSTTDYSEYDRVVITQETKDDFLPETHILEGSF